MENNDFNSILRLLIRLYYGARRPGWKIVGFILPSIHKTGSINVKGSFIYYVRITFRIFRPPPHCVFKWTLRGHFKPTTNATI